MEVFTSGKKIASRQQRDAAAAEIMTLLAGVPVVGYHDEQGRLILPADEDDDDY
ncbi:hypothetical protein [Methanomethylophilus alvi]|uniref:hypothetical protein n=1 Tax=Methanomethylophilus alvi TaxID=1291540 RepID=UPI0037DC8EB6